MQYTLASVLGDDFTVGQSSHTALPRPQDLSPLLIAWNRESGNSEALFTPVADIEVAALADAVRSVLCVPVMRLVDAGLLALSAPSEPLFYPVSEAEVVAFAPGSTVIVPSLTGTSEVLAKYVRYLTSVTNRFTTVSMYCSRNDSAAFDWHVDNWLSFIVQLHGTKRFEIRASRASPSEECVLGDGDGLVLRRLVEHRTTTISPSIHLAFAIHNESPYH
jgi:hypothetical protein